MPQESLAESRVFEHPQDTLDLRAITALLAAKARLLLIAPLGAGVVALGATYLVDPTFTARATFIPPQQQQTSAASALASIGALAGLAGSSGAVKSPADQYVSLLQSHNVQDRLIDNFGLMNVYDAEYRFEARKMLQDSVRISLGRKDGLITVEIDDKSPQRAADLANAHVDELRRLTTTLLVTEAQQRRGFFEMQLQRSKERLVLAEKALQASGFNQGALNAEPKAAAERYARLKAEVTAATVRMQTMGSFLNERSPELLQQRTTLLALQDELSRAERSGKEALGTNYISNYRDFKYEEALFELFARQYELARVDESREAPLIQVIDKALPPEKKSRPRRAFIALLLTASSALLMIAFVLIRGRLKFQKPLTSSVSDA